MKKIRMFVAVWCPHCTNAKGWLSELLDENSSYRNLPIELIDIDKDKDKLVGVNFYYVPTFYLDEEKVFEGVPSKESVRKVLDAAL